MSEDPRALYSRERPASFEGTMDEEKLYRVKIVTHAYVMARNEDHAEERLRAGEEMEREPESIEEIEVA